MPRSFSTKIITFAVLLAASVNLAWQFVRMEQESLERQEVYERSGLMICTLGPSVDELARMYVELLVIVAFVGTCLKGLKSTFLTVAGLTGAAIIYVFWWQVYFWLAEVSGSEMEFTQHTAYLLQASYLDIGIGASIAFLILMDLRYAVSRFRPESA